MGNIERIIEKYKDLLVGYANHYKYLNYDDIYNECVVYLLEAYQNNHNNPEYYVDYKIRKYVKKEMEFRNCYFYGLDTDYIKEGENQD